MGCAAVVRELERGPHRVLVSVRVCESGLDCRRVGQLESVDGAQLGACGCRVRVERVFPAEESVSGSERDGCQD